MKRKLHSRHGVALTEMLVAIAVLGLLTAAVVTGIYASVPVYQQSVALSEASVLTSTLSQAITDELHFARNITVSGDTVTFTSRNYGQNVSFSVNDKGHITLGGAELIGSGAYSNLHAIIAASYDNSLFMVKLTIQKSDFTVRETTFYVRPINAV